MSASTDDENHSPQADATRPSRPRRASLAELFAGRPSNTTDSSGANGGVAPKSVDSSYPGRPSGSSMASAMAMSQQQGHSRRLSLTTLGLSGSPTHLNPTSPFQPLRERSAGSISGEPARRPSMTEEQDESAVEDSDPVGPVNGSRTTPSSPGIGRRVSFGARAYGSMRTVSGGGGSPGSVSGGSNGSSESGSKAQSPPTPGAKFREGFNWSESLRNRAERSSVSGGGSGILPLTPAAHTRTKSNATISDPQGGSVAPKTPSKAPDHFQERILKGDFYMD